VDLMPAENGTTYVIEINSIPGWRGLQSTTNENIAQRIVDYLLNK
jgi:tetrahydromethanopterin:alpha-L-glutamate ligase